MIDFILRPFRRNIGKDKRFYAAVDDMFGFIPNNIELYKLALIHKSASVTMEDGRQVNNERLEYLGDAVIESVTSDYLFIEFPEKDEGFLTQLRSKMVSRQTLNDVAKRIGLDDYVITHTSNNMSQKHIYGDAFEAMMGAIYLDQGYDFVNRLLINKIFVDYIKVDDLTEAETDFKSRLIEWCQKNHHLIRFSTHHDRYFSSAHPSFYSKVLIDNIEVGYGVGDSKKEAEQRAASSVAHGVSDEDCTKLMDKLDVLEAQQLKSSKGNKRAAEEHNTSDAETVVPEVKADKKTEKKRKSASENEKSEKNAQPAVVKAEKKERREKPARGEQIKSEDKQHEKPVQTDKQHEKPVQTEKQPKPRRGRPRKSVAAEVAEDTKSEVVAAEPKPEKKAGGTRRTRKPKSESAKAKAQAAVEELKVENNNELSDGKSA